MKSTVTVKKSFVLYSDYYQHISLLSLEEKGMLLDAIFEYSNGKESELSPMANMAFSFIKSQMERDTLKYEERANRSRANGAKGGRPKENKDLPKTQNNPENPVGYLGTQNNPDEPRKPDTVSVTENVTATEPVTVIKKEVKPISEELTDVADWWNGIADKHNLTKIKLLSSSRKAKLNKRIKSIGSYEFFKETVETAIANSSFLTGDNNQGWKCDFDFTLQESSFIKMVEGKYKTEKKLTKSEQREADFVKLRQDRLRKESLNG